MNGWAGQRLKVYLTEGKIVKEPLPEDLRLNYLGGRGFNSKTIYDGIKPGVDPLGPENMVLVGVGPLNGTAVPASARWTVTSKSALTGGLGDGNGGGDFATELKFAGYDQVVFYGRSPGPVYLWIDDDKVELRDASGIWGKTTGETNEMIKEEHSDRDIRVMCIGPAGENLVRFAKVFANVTRAGGKGGMGAVMGSKNLKAIAVRGSGSVSIARPKEFFKAARRSYEKILASPYLQAFRETGTMFLTRNMESLKSLPTRNLQAGTFEGWEKLTSEVFEANYAIKHKGCSACPVACGHYYEVKEGPYANHGDSNEYGTTYPFGPKCGIDNLEAILLMGTMCDQLGLDTHSSGGIISFAMECWQRGLLKARDTGNLDLAWGNVDSVIELLKRITYRQGFGDVLAEGSFRASKRIEGSEVCLKTVKGLEVSALFLGPFTDMAVALGYAVATRGADHLRGTMPCISSEDRRLKEIFGDPETVQKYMDNPRSIEKKGVFTALNEDGMAMVNALNICCFVVGDTRRKRLVVEDLEELMSTCTGVDMNGDDLMKVGERITNIEKAFNVREGMR
ncbi:MAG: aldehyde ferredoxin oxidoreductase family protein, partial [Dehalococcoidia bacterium]|nr:aldehyde ferredoxin oxidoreductase family protein [Dehalococcoidia bacterium]